MKKSKEEIELHFRPREKETVSIEMPKDVITSLKKVAKNRDMSYHALIRFYIGQGLRQDLAQVFADRVLDTTADILSRHIQSKEEVSAIIREIQDASVRNVGKQDVAA